MSSTWMALYEARERRRRDEAKNAKYLSAVAATKAERDHAVALAMNAAHDRNWTLACELVEEAEFADDAWSAAVCDALKP